MYCFLHFVLSFTRGSASFVGASLSTALASRWSARAGVQRPLLLWRLLPVRSVRPVWCGKATLFFSTALRLVTGLCFQHTAPHCSSLPPIAIGAVRPHSVSQASSHCRNTAWRSSLTEKATSISFLIKPHYAFSVPCGA